MHGVSPVRGRLAIEFTEQVRRGFCCRLGPPTGAQQRQDHKAEPEPEQYPPHGMGCCRVSGSTTCQRGCQDGASDRDAECGAGLAADRGQRSCEPAMDRGIPETAVLVIGGLTMARKIPTKT